MSRTYTTNLHWVLKYLTPYAAKETHRQLTLSRHCLVVRVTKTKFYVVKRKKLPQNIDEYSVIPRYRRVRVVEFVNDKYASCTCGYPARVKRPCCHIISVVGLHTSMFGLRWLAFYQLAFLRPGRSDINSKFRQMEEEEFGRNWDGLEHVNVEGLIPRYNVEKLPRPYFGAEDEHVGYIISLHDKIK